MLAKASHRFGDSVQGIDGSFWLILGMTDICRVRNDVQLNKACSRLKKLDIG